MSRSGTNNKASSRNSEVTFSIEVCPATSAQIEAGKRLFSRLINRAQNDSNTAKARAQAGAEAPPAD